MYVCVYACMYVCKLYVPLYKIMMVECAGKKVLKYSGVYRRPLRYI